MAERGKTPSKRIRAFGVFWFNRCRMAAMPWAVSSGEDDLCPMLFVPIMITISFGFSPSKFP